MQLVILFDELLVSPSAAIQHVLLEVFILSSHNIGFRRRLTTYAGGLKK